MRSARGLRFVVFCCADFPIPFGFTSAIPVQWYELSSIEYINVHPWINFTRFISFVPFWRSLDQFYRNPWGSFHRHWGNHITAIRPVTQPCRMWWSNHSNQILEMLYSQEQIKTKSRAHCMRFTVNMSPMHLNVGDNTPIQLSACVGHLALHVHDISLYSKSQFLHQYIYRKISNIRRTEFQNLNVSHLGLQWPLRNILKPDVKWRMKM